MTASTKAKPDLDAIEARARETARRLGLGEEPEEWEIAELTEQIRQAEQAARADERRKTLEECKQVAARLGSVVLLNEISALAKDSEPGEAAGEP